MEFKKLLIVGSIPDEKNMLNYGGATVLTKNFIDYLASQREYEYSFVQNNKYSNIRTRKPIIWRNYLYFLLMFLFRILRCDVVMFNFSDHGTVSHFPFLCKIAKHLKKKVVLRKFGGSFDIYLKNIKRNQLKKTIDALQKADVIFFETQSGIKHLQQLIKRKDNIHWFPNVRKNTLLKKDTKNFNGRCVFMSHITKEKGIDDIIQVAKILPKQYSIDVYGEIKEKSYRTFDFGKYNIKYHGVISSEKVLKTLIKYDLLLLPTSYREGYPGIIIEAMSVGVPCISTFVGGIPEIVENGFNGLLVNPGDINGIKQAIVSINESNYKKYSKNAISKFNESFNSDFTNKRILKIMMEDS